MEAAHLSIVRSNSTRAKFICLMCKPKVELWSRDAVLRGAHGVSVKVGAKYTFRDAAIVLICLAVGGLFGYGCDDYLIPIYQTNTGQSSNGGLGSGITVNIAPSGIIFVDVGKQRQVSVTLQNDTGNQGVNWSLSGPGTLTQATPTSVMYTAPTTQNTPATLSATAVADNTQVASATVYSVPLPTVQTTTLPGGTVGAEYSQVVNALNGAAPYSWSITSGGLPPGVSFSISSSAAITIEGAPTTSGTFNVTFELSDVCSATATQAFSIVIAAASGSSSSSVRALGGNGANNALVNGNYSFQFAGSGPPGAAGAAGSFSADGNGNISGGTLDRNSAAGLQKALVFTGTYAVGANQLGYMILNYADGTTVTYAMAVAGDGSARFIEFEDASGMGSIGSGVMTKQNAASLASLAPAGNYAFELGGVDASGARIAMAGQFTADTTGAIAAGALDVNDDGTMLSQATATGNYQPIATGDGSAMLNVGGAIGAVHLSLFPVSADEMYAVETDPVGQPLLVGTIVRQSSGPFTDATLSGNEIIQMTGAASGSMQMVFGLLNADGAGSAAISAAQMTADGASELDAKYSTTVGATGRAALGPNAGSPIIYLTAANEGFVLGTDSSVMTGWIGPESSQTMTASVFSGTMTGGSIVSASPGMTESIISLSFDGKGNVSGTGASSGPNGLMILPIQQATYKVGAGDIFVSVTWPLQNPQPMLIASPTSLIVAPSGATFVPIVVQK
jgi:large repetitive protein